MTIEEVAAAVESVYYGGRVKAERRLDRDDFMMLVRMAHGTVLRKVFREQELYRRTIEYYAQHVERKEFPLTNRRGGKKVLKFGDESAISRLPKGLGVFAVYVLDDDGNDDGNDYIRILAGSEWLLKGRDFADMKTFSLVGATVEISGACPDSKTAETLGIFSDEGLEVSPDLAFDVVNAVLATVLGRGSGFPVDKTDNQNPNVAAINQRLTQTVTNEQ